jgi:hypothetical protein
VGFITEDWIAGNFYCFILRKLAIPRNAPRIADVSCQKLKLFPTCRSWNLVIHPQNEKIGILNQPDIYGKDITEFSGLKPIYTRNRKHNIYIAQHERPIFCLEEIKIYKFNIFLFLNYFNILILKIIFKNKKNIILIHY